MLVMPRLPGVLFKYTRQEHADAMIRRGSFRIGTLYEFRKVEAHGPEVGDEGEGTKQVFDIANGHWRDVTARPNLAQRFIAADPNANITFKNVGFQVDHEAPDAFVYCVTAIMDHRAMRDFGADTCVEITNPKRFFEELDHVLRTRHLVGESVTAPCFYGERRRHIITDGNLHPAFLKPPRYAYQREIRVVWEARQPPIGPIIVESLPASQYLRQRSLAA